MVILTQKQPMKESMFFCRAVPSLMTNVRDDYQLVREERQRAIADHQDLTTLVSSPDKLQTVLQYVKKHLEHPATPAQSIHRTRLRKLSDSSFASLASLCPSQTKQ